MPDEELEIIVKETSNRIFLDFINSPTTKQGYAVVEIEDLKEDSPYADFLGKHIGIGETYARISQFYPNGKRCDDSELRQGRGTILLDKIFEYLITRGLPFIFCYSDKENMNKFLTNKGFKEIKKGHYFKELKIKRVGK